MACTPSSATRAPAMSCCAVKTLLLIGMLWRQLLLLHVLLSRLAVMLLCLWQQQQLLLVSALLQYKLFCTMRQFEQQLLLQLLQAVATMM